MTQQKTILALCERILSATDNIVSVGASATMANAPQLMGIRQAVQQIAVEIQKEEEVKSDG